MKIALQGTMSDGSPAPSSLLASATWSIDDTSIADIVNGQIVPVSNGTTKAIANVQGISTEIMVIVNNPQLDRVIVNNQTVMAVLGSVITIDTK